MATRGKISVNRSLNQFNGGELSPQLEGRYDWNKYNYSAKLCQNFIPTIEGSLKRRGGSRFVCATSFLPVFTITLNITPSSPVGEVILYIDDQRIVSNESSDFTGSGTQYTYSGNFDADTNIKIRVVANGFYDESTIVVADDNKTIDLTLRAYEDFYNLTIIPHPADCVVTINGEETRTAILPKEVPVDVYLKLFGKSSYYEVTDITEDTVLNLYYRGLLVDLSSQSPVTKFTSRYFEEGEYYVTVVGAGGGAGGGSYGDGKKSTGGGGGGGAAFVGKIRIPAGTYTMKAGRCGLGGDSGNKSGEKGSSGDSSYIGNLIIAEGGSMGLDKVSSGYSAGADSVTCKSGYGGNLTVNAEVILAEVQSHGEGDGLITGKGASSLVTPWGKGGDGKWKSKGGNGVNGIVQVSYYKHIEN